MSYLGLNWAFKMSAKCLGTVEKVEPESIWIFVLLEIREFWNISWSNRMDQRVPDWPSTTRFLGTFMYVILPVNRFLLMPPMISSLVDVPGFPFR